MNRVVLGMAALRLISALIELTAAVLFLRFNDVAWALRINIILGLIGQFVFIGINLLGITGLASDIPFQKMILIVMGTIMVFLGTVK